MSDLNGKIAVVLTGDERIDRLAGALSGAAWVELRFDRFLAGHQRGDPFRWASAVRRVFGGRIIATVRSEAEAGERSVRIADEERETLYRGALRWADYVDVELNSNIAGVVVKLAQTSGRQAILSVHNFSGTPPHRAMMASLGRCRRMGGDVFKIAARASSPGDLMTLIWFTHRAAGQFPVIVCPMACGVPGRLAPLAFGSMLSYAYLGTATAPGQPAWRALRLLSGSSPLAGGSKEGETIFEEGTVGWGMHRKKRNEEGLDRDAWVR